MSKFSISKKSTKSVNERNQFWIAFLGNVKKEWLVLIFLTFLSLLTFIVTPWIIPPDGSLYLSSARAAFSPDWFGYYHWMREPLYPIFLKILLLGNKLSFVMFVQTILIGSSVFLVYIAFSSIIKMSPLEKLVTTGIAFLFVRGFATEILMQSLLIFIVSVACYLNSKMINEERPSSKITGLAIQGCLLCVFAFLLQILVGIAVLTIYLASLMFLNSKGITFKLRFALLTLFSCMLVMGSWQSFKDTAIQSGNLIFGSNSLSEYKFFESSDPEKRHEQRIQAFTGTLGLAPERDAYISRPVGVALREWAMPFFNNKPWNQNGECGQYDTSHSQKILEYIEPLKEQRACKTELQVSISNALSYIGIAIYPIFSVIIIFYLVIMFGTANKILITLIGTPALMLVEYTLVGQGHSRFAAPLFLLSPFLLLHFIKNRNTFQIQRISTLTSKYPEHRKRIKRKK